MPSSWVAPPTTQASVTIQAPLEAQRWWTAFNDPELDVLIHQAVASNLDYQTALQKVRAARASLGVAVAGFFPTANANGSYNRSGGELLHAHDLWQAGFDAAWELDVFGGVRRNIESARASLEATEEDRRDVLRTLLAEVATDYLMLRGFQQEIVIAQENLDAQVRTAAVTRRKVEGGLTTDLDVANADAQVATTRSQIAGLEQSEQQQIYAISVLLGQEPAALLAELSVRRKIPITPPLVPVGLPSELLRRRPDIRKAERELAASTALIGVATADLFPKFTFGGDVGVGGSRFSNLGNWATHTWSFGPSFTWRIFDAGAIWSNIQVQNAMQAQALIAYRQTVLTALQDVESALTAYAQEQHRRAAIVEAVTANQKAVSIARRRYDQGLTDFLTVLDAQRSLYSSQDAQVQSDRTVATDLVALYKALGGGWEIGEPSSTTRPAQ